MDVLICGCDQILIGSFFFLEIVNLLLVSNNAYTIEETDAMTQVAEYPNLGYTLYKLKDPTHLPVMYGGTVE